MISPIPANPTEFFTDKSRTFTHILFRHCNAEKILNRFGTNSCNMKKLILAVVLSLACLIATNTMANTNRGTDSAKVNHQVDGNINEWKIEKFETDKETQVLYAVDHDAGNLYLAMKIADQRMQMKMMMNGMRLFVDKKGKKKEGTGIEFPVKREGEGGGFGGRGGGGGGRNAATSESGERTAPDPKEMRERMSTMMILLKTFGFDDQEDKVQLISEPNGINLAFDWDDANNMYIEYLIPMKFLGKNDELNNKPLGIGWKINGVSFSGGGGSTGTTTQLIAVPAGSGSRGGGGGGGGGSRTGRGASAQSVDFGSSTDSRFKEQSIWTKYVLTF